MNMLWFRHCMALIIFAVSSFVIPSPLETHGVEESSAKSVSGRTGNGGWTEDELKEKPGDAQVLRNPSAPARSSPARLRPGTVDPELPPQLRNSIRSVKINGDQKLLALTFDLCERERGIGGYDAEIVNFLRANKVKATFFASGKWMRSHPEKTMQLMSDPLFEVGNHGWSHRNIRMLDRKAAEEEILWAQAQYELIWEDLQKLPCALSAGEGSAGEIPRVPRVFRFPFGTCSPDALGLLQTLGLPAVQWDIVSGDAAKGRTASGIAALVLNQAKSGSIIVFHANGRGHGTAASLPIFVPKLIKNGFSFVTVSELISSGTPVAAPDCYELRPGDNLRYDKLLTK